MHKILPFLLMICAAAAGAGEAHRIRALMLWLPQAEFAGFYMARADRLYEEAGLKVEIDHPTADEEIFDTLAGGEADVIVGWPLAALSRAAAGEDVVNIGQLARRSALMLIARRSSGIDTPEDIAGHRVGLWPSESLQSTLLSFFDHYGVDDYTVVPVYTNADLFLYGGVDVTVGVRYDEYYRIYAAGIDPEELTLFYLNDLFPRLVDDGLYCKQRTYRDNPEAYRKFLEATLEGWRRAFADPERALELVRRECAAAGVPYSRVHQRWMLDAMKMLIFPEGETNDGAFLREYFDECMKLLDADAPEVTFETFAAARQEDGP